MLIIIADYVVAHVRWGVGYSKCEFQTKVTVLGFLLLLRWVGGYNGGTRVIVSNRKELPTLLRQYQAICQLWTVVVG